MCLHEEQRSVNVAAMQINEIRKLETTILFTLPSNIYITDNFVHKIETATKTFHVYVPQYTRCYLSI